MSVSIVKILIFFFSSFTLFSNCSESLNLSDLIETAARREFPLDRSGFYDSFKSEPVQFINKLISYGYHENVIEIFRTISESSDLFDCLLVCFPDLSSPTQIEVLALTMATGAPKEFYFNVIKEKENDFFLHLMQKLLNILMFENESLLKYEDLDELFMWFESNRMQFLQSFYSRLITEFRIKAKILFGAFDEQFYENQIKSAPFNHATIAEFTILASAAGREKLLKILFTDSRNSFEKCYFRTNLKIEQLNNSYFLLKADRFIFQMAERMPDASCELNVINYLRRFSPCISRNYSLESIERGVDGVLKIGFKAMNGRFENGFPESLDFVIEIDFPIKLFWYKIALNIKQASSSALMYMFTEYLQSPSLIYDILKAASHDLIRMCTEHVSVHDFLNANNVQFELSFEVLMELLENECDPMNLISIIKPLPIEILVPALLSAKSEVELFILEGVSVEKRIDEIYLNWLNDKYADDQFYSKIRHIIKYWINGPFKDRIFEIKSKIVKSLIRIEFAEQATEIESNLMK